MSWPQWPVGGASALPGLINPAPTVANPMQPVLNPMVPSAVPPQYTTEQWAQMQHQNWQQWAQWQQQYQQWHQQYGAEYQKVLNAQGVGGVQPPLPVPQVAAQLPNTSLPPPPPTEPKPPLPPEEPPHANNQSYNNQQAPSKNFPGGRNSNWQNAGDSRNRRYSNQGPPPSPPDHGFGKRTSSFSGGGGDQKRLRPEENWQKNNETPASNQWNSTPPHKPPPKAGTSVEELSEAEKKFDKQFAEWEAQFSKWKEQNANHPDKTQYREYEKKWETWRAQLLERREQMRRKRLNLTNPSPKLPQPEKKQPLLSTPIAPPDAQIASFNRPPPTVNNDPLEFTKKTLPGFDDGENIQSEAVEKKEFDTNFLNTSSAGGIPGLDLVKDDDNGENPDSDAVDGDRTKSPIFENTTKPQDLEALSKGINNILGDQKLLSMLSLVSQNQNLNFNTSNTTSQMNLEKNDQSNQSLEENSNPGGSYSFNKPNDGFNTFDDQTRSSFTTGANDQDMRFEQSRPEDPVNHSDFRGPPAFQNFRPNDNYFREEGSGGPRAGNDFRGPQDEMRGGGSDLGGGFRGPKNMEAPGDFEGAGDFNQNKGNWGDGYNAGSNDFNRGGPNEGNRGGPNNFNRGGPNNFNRGGPNDFNRSGPSNDFNRAGPNDFNRGGPNDFNRGGAPNEFNRGPNDFNRGGPNDFSRGGAPNEFNRGPNDFNRGGPNNFNRGAASNDVNRGGPNDFNRGGPNDFNRGSAPNNFNKGGPNDFNRGGPNDFNTGGAPNDFNRGGPNDFNRGGPNNFNSGGAPNDFNRGGPNDFNRGGPNNFNSGGAPNDFSRRGPNDFNRGPNDFNKGAPNFERFNEDANRNTFNKPDRWAGDGGPGGINRNDRSNQDNFGPIMRDNFRGNGPNRFGGGDDNFRGGPSGFGNFSEGPNYMGDNRNNQNYPSGDARGPLGPSPSQRPPRGDENFGNREHFGAQPNELWRRDRGTFPQGPNNQQFSRGPLLDNKNQPERFSGPPHDNRQQFNSSYDGNSSQLLKEPPVVASSAPVPESVSKPAVEQEILKPETVVEYDHKSLKAAEPEVIVEPIQTFDYRHKPVNRIPLPQRPQWLMEILRNVREFEPLLNAVRSFEQSRRYSDWMYEDRKKYDSYYDERRRYDDYSESRRGYEERRSYERSRSREHDDFNEDSRHGYKSYRRSEERRRYEDEISPVRTHRYEEKTQPSHSDRYEEKERKVSGEVVEESVQNPSSAAVNMAAAGGSSKVTLIEDILSPPGRFSRPPRIVIILRGPPGSGKTTLAKLIKDKEVENGGSAPRILSLDDYFMVEHEKEIVEEGRKIRIKEMTYEYEECMEASYRVSLMKSFKKTITDGYFNFIIVDNVNDKVKYFGEMWSFAKQNGFQVYICQMELDVQTCTKRNVHERTEEEIERCVAGWEPTPAHHPVVDATSLVQAQSIPEVEMEEINSPPSMEEGGDEEHSYTSKWDTFDCSVDNLAKLDGTSKPLKPAKTMEDYLQLDAWEPKSESSKPGQKRVRWADLEERKEQEKMRAIGFVVGQTNWDRMMDPTMGGSALTQTKYIERVGKY